MPLLYHETNLRSRIPSITLPSWWRQKVSKYSSKDDDDITGATSTTRDWRSLSPNKPPLPFVHDNDQNGTNSDIYPHTQASERAPKRLPIPKKYRHSTCDDDQFPKLSTIIEESDLLTEISLSPKNSSNQRQRQRHQQEEREYGFVTSTEPVSVPSSPPHNHDKNNDINLVPSPALPPNDSPHPSSTGSTSSALPANDAICPPASFSSPSSSTRSASPTNNNSSFIESSTLTLPPLSIDSTSRHATTTEMALSSSDSSSLSSSSLLSIPVQKDNNNSISGFNSISASTTTIEDKAKKDFIKMIQAVYKCRQVNNNQVNMPSDMKILFDSIYNVHRSPVWINDKMQSPAFKGDSQYILPELPMGRRPYGDNSVAVWILGISLYRMLVGKYPFQTDNDHRLLSTKMQHIDVGIPSHLSSDAKDLLRRMLAPNHSRASLDLVMFHPWLKPYSVGLIPFVATASTGGDKVDSTSTIININNNSLSPRAVQEHHHRSVSTPSTPEFTNHHHSSSGKKRKSIVSKLKRAVVFMVTGPCPPPTHPYRDLSPTKSF
ncbi:unnamed protein product [Absidia cylindrospora]